MVLAITYFSESAIQAGVSFVESSNSWFFEKVNKVQSLVYAANLGAIFVGFLALAESLDKKMGLYKVLAGPSGQSLVFPIVCVIGGIGLVVFKIVKTINSYFRPNENLALALADFPPTERSLMAVSWGNSAYQKWMQRFEVAKLVISIALLFFSANPYFFGASGALQLYSFWKICKWKSIRFDRIYVVPKDIFDRSNGPLRFTFSYFCSIFPANANTDQCNICRDRQVTSLFHAGHSFCNPCLVNTIAGRSVEFLRQTRWERTIMQKKQNGQIVDEYPSYKIIFLKNNLPPCPLCRERPAYHEMQVSVLDRHNFKEQNIYASVKISSEVVPA